MCCLTQVSRFGMKCYAWWPLKSFQLHKLQTNWYNWNIALLTKQMFFLLLADLVYVELLMIGELPAEVYHMRIHNQSSTITVLHDSFQMLTTVTEHSLAGSMFALGYQYTKHISQVLIFLWNLSLWTFSFERRSVQSGIVTWYHNRQLTNLYFFPTGPALP